MNNFSLSALFCSALQQGLAACPPVRRCRTILVHLLCLVRDQDIDKLEEELELLSVGLQDIDKLEEELELLWVGLQDIDKLEEELLEEELELLSVGLQDIDKLEEELLEEELELLSVGLQVYRFTASGFSSSLVL